MYIRFSQICQVLQLQICILQTLFQKQILKQDQQQNPKPQDQESQQDNTKQPQQPKEQKISKEEAQRILDALKNNEKDLQKQLRKKTGRTKQTDKDW